jgi:hypothetical protein
MMASTNIMQHPSFDDREALLLATADVVTAPALAVEVGMGGT